MAETNAFEICSLAKKRTSIMNSDSSFVSIVKFAVNFCTAFENRREVPNFEAEMVGIVKEIVLSKFLTGKRS